MIRGACAIVNESIKGFLTRTTDRVDVMEMCGRIKSNESADQVTQLRDSPISSSDDCLVMATAVTKISDLLCMQQLTGSTGPETN